MIQTNIARESGWAWAWVGAAALVFVLTLGLSWFAQRWLEASFERLDARTLDGAARLLDSHFAHQREQLAATVGVLSEDSRIRAMVLTPTFDRATVMDLLTDLKATSGATMVALLDAAG